MVGWGSIAGLICISILKSWYLYSFNWLFKTLHRERISTKNIAKIVGPPIAYAPRASQPCVYLGSTARSGFVHFHTSAVVGVNPLGSSAVTAASGRGCRCPAELVGSGNGAAIAQDEHGKL